MELERSLADVFTRRETQMIIRKRLGNTELIELDNKISQET